MVDIYKIQTNIYFESETINSLKELVSNEKKERVEKFMCQQDSLKCLLGDLLSRYAIYKRSGYKNSQLKFGVNEYNKPILINPDNLYFNISHSGNWVVCTVADDVVGVDVELIRNTTNFEVAKRFFTKDEYSSLIKQDSTNQIKYFYLLWTLKESYIKADGRGLSLSLKSFSINVLNNEISITTNNELNKCFFRKYDIDDAHICSVCSLDHSFSSTIKEVTIFELLQDLY